MIDDYIIMMSYFDFSDMNVSVVVNVVITSITETSRTVYFIIYIPLTFYILIVVDYVEINILKIW